VRGSSGGARQVDILQVFCYITFHQSSYPDDKRYYSTIREDGAESLQGLTETAGLPKYHTISGPGCSVSGEEIREWGKHLDEEEQQQ